MEGWVKLYRKLEEWQWINKPEMVSLFIYCLIRANHSDCIWQNIEIKRGTFITSPEKLSNKLGIKYQTVRTCLTRLEKTGEINKQTTNKYTIITINNYDSYQYEQQTKIIKTNKQLTNNQQTTNKQLTTDKNEKNNKNVNNEKNKEIDFDFIESDYSESFLEWVEYKKERKQSYKTQKSIEAAYCNLKLLSELNPEVAKKIVFNSIANNWAGLFKLKNDKQTNNDKAGEYVANRLLRATGN